MFNSQKYKNSRNKLKAYKGIIISRKFKVLWCGNSHLRTSSINSPSPLCPLPIQLSEEAWVEETRDLTCCLQHFHFVSIKIMRCTLMSAFLNFHQLKIVIRADANSSCHCTNAEFPTDHLERLLQKCFCWLLSTLITTKHLPETSICWPRCKDTYCQCFWERWAMGRVGGPYSDIIKLSAQSFHHLVLNF